jgi:hypothetical protein
VTDTLGESDVATTTAVVSDTVAPVLTCPTAAPAECAGPGGAAVTIRASASDACGGGAAIVNNRGAGGADASGLYPVGATPVTFTATDGAGNKSACTALVRVLDSAPPALACPPPARAECSGPAGAAVGVVATASDLCSPPVAFTNTRNGAGADASGVYPLGATPVGFTGTDAAGNAASCATNVTVVDTSAPALTVPAGFSLDATLPAGAVLTYTSSAADTCAGPVTPLCVPPSGTLFHVNSPGQTTAVMCTATDPRGNRATASFPVHVAGAAEQIANLEGLVDGLALPRLLSGALRWELEAALASIREGKPKEACLSMKAFLETVRIWSTLRTPKISPAQAAPLLDAAARIRAVLGCSQQRKGARVETEPGASAIRP